MDFFFSSDCWADVENIRHFLKLDFYGLKYLLSYSQTVSCRILIQTHGRACTTAKGPEVTPKAQTLPLEFSQGKWFLLAFGYMWKQIQIVFLSRKQQTQQAEPQVSVLGRPLCSRPPAVCSSVLGFNQSVIIDQIHLGSRKCVQKWKIGGIWLGWKWEESISSCKFYRCGTFVNEALSEVLVGYELYIEPNFPGPLFFPL